MFDEISEPNYRKGPNTVMTKTNQQYTFIPKTNTKAPIGISELQQWEHTNWKKKLREEERLTLKMRDLLEDSQAKPPLKCMFQINTVIIPAIPRTWTTNVNGTAGTPNAISDSVSLCCCCFFFLLFRQPMLLISLYSGVWEPRAGLTQEIWANLILTIWWSSFVVFCWIYATWFFLIGCFRDQLFSASCLDSAPTDFRTVLFFLFPILSF